MLAGFFGLNAFAESAAIHSLLHDDAPADIPSFQTSLMPVVDVVHIERSGFESWRAGDSGTAIRAFSDAAATWAERGFHRFAARCSFAAGELARRGGDERAARRHLCAAAEVATRWRLAPIIAATQQSHHRSRLSRREVEVLELVAAGRTAPQIAVTLGVGESTVVSHINSARTKLGARTRMQAASMIAGGAR